MSRSEPDAGQEKFNRCLFAPTVLNIKMPLVLGQSLGRAVAAATGRRFKSFRPDSESEQLATLLWWRAAFVAKQRVAVAFLRGETQLAGRHSSLHTSKLEAWTVQVNAWFDVVP